MTTRQGAAAGEPTKRPLSTVVRYEGEKRLRMTGIIAVLFLLLGGLYVWLGPELVGAESMEELIEALPPALATLLGFESLASLSGLLASEFYTFGWMVGLGGYVAYSGAGRVAGGLDDGRMDSLLAAPVDRRTVLVGTLGGLFVPIGVLNIVVPAGLYLASVAVGEPLPVTELAVVHALSVPYLLCWGAVGLLAGVRLRGSRTAGRAALGAVFAAWFVESVLRTTDYTWLGAISPTRYYDPPAILVHSEFDFLGAAFLSVVTVAILAIASHEFQGRDL